jgi:hypothetical protein
MFYEISGFNSGACEECRFFGMFRRVGLVGTNVSEEHIASVFRVERISEIGTLASVC